jgi:hypothetical protein
VIEAGCPVKLLKRKPNGVTGKKFLRKGFKCKFELRKLHKQLYVPAQLCGAAEGSDTTVLPRALPPAQKK